MYSYLYILLILLIILIAFNFYLENNSNVLVFVDDIKKKLYTVLTSIERA